MAAPPRSCIAGRQHTPRRWARRRLGCIRAANGAGARAPGRDACTRRSVGAGAHGAGGRLRARAMRRGTPTVPRILAGIGVALLAGLGVAFAAAPGSGSGLLRALELFAVIMLGLLVVAAVAAV